MRIFTLALTALLSCSAIAGAKTGRITGFVPYSSGDREILFFSLDNSVSEGCNVSARFAIDNTSLIYKATLSAVIAAYHAQSSVKVNYLDSCNVWGNSADVKSVCFRTINYC